MHMERQEGSQSSFRPAIPCRSEELKLGPVRLGEESIVFNMRNNAPLQSRQ